MVVLGGGGQFLLSEVPLKDQTVEHAESRRSHWSGDGVKVDPKEVLRSPTALR